MVIDATLDFTVMIKSFVTVERHWDLISLHIKEERK